MVYFLQSEKRLKQQNQYYYYPLQSRIAMNISTEELLRYHHDKYVLENAAIRSYVLLNSSSVFSKDVKVFVGSDTGSGSTLTPVPGPIEIDLNDIEIDPESLEGITDISDHPQVIEYLRFKQTHQENFLRDVVSKGLKKQDSTHTASQSQTKPMNY